MKYAHRDVGYSSVRRVHVCSGRWVPPFYTTRLSVYTLHLRGFTFAAIIIDNKLSSILDLDFACQGSGYLAPKKYAASPAYSTALWPVFAFGACFSVPFYPSFSGGFLDFFSIANRLRWLQYSICRCSFRRTIVLLQQNCTWRTLTYAGIQPSNCPNTRRYIALQVSCPTHVEMNSQLAGILGA